MTRDQNLNVYRVVRKLLMLDGPVKEKLPPVSDLAEVRVALATLNFPQLEPTLMLLALVCVDEIDDSGSVRVLRDLANDDALAARLIRADKPIDRVTFLTLFYGHVCAVLTVNAWRQLSSRNADGRVRAAHTACEIIEAALALGVMTCERIDSLLDLHELSVDAQHLLESESNQYPAGPVPLPAGMHWVRDGREAAELMRSPQGRLFFDYENRVGNYHTCYTGGTHFLGVNAEGVLFSFGWFRYPGEPVLTSKAVSPSP